MVGEQISNEEFVTDFRVDAITEAGRHFLNERSGDSPGNRKPRKKLLIFVSHPSVDLPVVEALVELIRAALSIEPDQIRASSVDGMGLGGGAETGAKIRDKLMEAPESISVVTPNSVAT